MPATEPLGLSSLFLNGYTAQSDDDDPDAFRVPALDGLVIGTQHFGQAPPGKEVPAARWVHERAAADDAAQEVAVLGNQGQIAECHVHAADPARGRHRRAYFGRRPAIAFGGFP